MLSCRHGAEIVRRYRRIIDDVDAKGGGCLVPIDICDGDGEEVGTCRIRRVVGQQVIVTDTPVRDAGDRKNADVGGKGLTDFGNDHTVDGDVLRAVGRTEIDETVSRFRIGRFVGAFRLAAALWKSGLVHDVFRIDDRNAGIVDLDVDDRSFVDQAGNNFFFSLLRLGQVRVGQQIAQVESRLDLARIGGEIAAGARIRSRLRLRFVADQEGSDVGRRDRHAVGNDLRQDDGTFGHHDARAVGQDDDQVGAVERQAVDRLAGWQHDGIVGTCRDNLRRLGGGLHGHRLADRPGLLRFRVEGLRRVVETVKFFTHCPFPRSGGDEAISSTPRHDLIRSQSPSEWPSKS